MDYDDYCLIGVLIGIVFVLIGGVSGSWALMMSGAFMAGFSGLMFIWRLGEVEEENE